MQTHKKLKARILSLALSAAMVFTMMPSTVFAVEGDVPLGASSLGTIQSFDKLEDRFIPSVGENAPDYVYGLPVELNTPEEDLQLPDELTAMVARTVTAPVEDDLVVDSGKPSTPAEDETIPDEDEVATDDTAADDTVSGNQPASPSDAEEEVKEEIKDEDVPLAPEPEQDEGTVTTTIESESIPVAWNSDKEYKSDENGKFIYTAVLPEGYTLADGVKLPQIYVYVGRQARSGDLAHDISSGSLTLTSTCTCTESNPHVVTGTTTANKIEVTSGTHYVTLDSVSITEVVAPFAIANGATVYLTLKNGTTNILTAKDVVSGSVATANAGLQVPAGATLVIDGTGTLNATGASNSGVLVYAAGIGGNGNGNDCDAGTITIKGGTIVTNAVAAAGIGSGANQEEGVSGTVTAINIVGGNVTANTSGFAAAIGGASGGGCGGAISITGGTVTTNVGTNGFMGIGNGKNGTGGSVTISGATTVVNAKGGMAAINTDTLTLTGMEAKYKVNTAYTGATNISSNKIYEGTTQTTEATDVKIAPAASNVCAIDSQGYPTLAEAVTAAATSGDTIRILEDIDLGNTGVTIAGDKSVTLDLADKAVTYTGNSSTIELTGSASLTIEGISGGTLSAANANAIQNSGTGTLTIAGGTVSGTGGPYTICNVSTGAVIVSGGTVSAGGQYAGAIKNDGIGKITITGGTVTSANETNATGGTILMSAVPTGDDKVVLDIQGGTVSNTANTGDKWAVHFSGSSGVTPINVGDYYSEAEDATVGNVYPNKPAACAIGTTVYDSLQDAVNAAANTGDTIKVLRDIDLEDGGVSIETKAIILDLDGHKVTAERTKDEDVVEGVFQLGGGSLTIIGTAEGSQLESTGTGIAAIFNTGSGNVTVQSGTVTSKHNVITNRSTGTVTVSGGTLKTMGTAGNIIQNGYPGSASGNVTVSGGLLEAAGALRAIYQTGDSTVTISGGIVKADTSSAIYSAAGKVVISGTAVVSSNNETTGTIERSDVPASGDKLTLDFQGGTVKNEAEPEGYSIYFSANGVTSANVETYYAEADDAIVGKIYPAAPVCAIGQTKYSTLQDAVDDALVGGNTSTITVLRNIDLGTTGVTIGGKFIVLDLNGKEITFKGATLSSAISMSNQARLTVTDSSEAKDGKLQATVAGGKAINNGSTGFVKVESGTVSSFGTTIYIQGGDLEISGGTVISALDGGTTVYNAGTGTVTVSDGVITLPDGGGTAIHNNSTGMVHISGGTVSAPDTNGNAIVNSTSGRIVISQAEGKTTLVTSGNSSATQGTILLLNVPTTGNKLVLDIQGGTVQNTATPDEGYSVYYKKAEGANPIVTPANRSDYYSAASTATVGRVFPGAPSGSFVAVTDVTGVPTMATEGTDLTLSGTVAPTNATNKTIVWSVKSAGATGATIVDGKLKTTAAGTVVVTATITNGLTASSNYTKDFTITVYPVGTVLYTITFNANGGSVSPATATTDAAGKLSGLPTPTRSGYTFNGWFTAASGGTAVTTTTVFTQDSTVYAQWTQNSGGGGDSTPTPPSGGSAGGVTTPGKTVIDNPVGNQGSKSTLAEAVKNAIATGTTNPIVYTNFANYTALTKDGLKAINDATAEAVAGKNVQLSTKVQLDNKVGNAVISRITVDPVKLATVMPDKLNLGVWFDQKQDRQVTSVTNLFEKAFDNKIVTVTFEQKSPLAVSMEFAAKPDLSALNTKNLYFYSYDPVKNIYNRIAAPNYWVDKNGYSHITAPFGGSIIISDKPLVKK